MKNGIRIWGWSFCLLFFPPASNLLGVGFGISSGLDYQNRHFQESGLEYDLDYWGLFVKPSLAIVPGWSVFVRLGYCRVVFDRPEFGATDYDRWGWEWGGGSHLTLFRWSGLYAALEGEVSRTNTKGNAAEGGREESLLLLWSAGARAGWNLGVVDPYVGWAYTDGTIDYRYSSPERSFSEDYRLREQGKAFIGGRINLPPFSNFQGRYYFGRDTLAVFSVGLGF